MEEENFEEIIHPNDNAIEVEVINEEDNKLINDKSVITTALEKKRGKLTLKYRMIAEHAARGYSPEIISQIVGIKVGTVYSILENNEQVWEEINKIITNLFSEGDRILANLYIKALHKLDERLESDNSEIQSSAIKDILTCYGKKGEDGRPAILQVFSGMGGQSSAPLIDSIDQIILKRRKERGLSLPEKIEKNK